MTSPAITITPGASLTEAAQVMGRNGVKRLPVVEDDRVVGIACTRRQWPREYRSHRLRRPRTDVARFLRDCPNVAYAAVADGYRTNAAAARQWAGSDA